MKNLRTCTLAAVVSALSLSLISGSAFARGGFAGSGGMNRFGGGGFAVYGGTNKGAGILQKLDENNDGIVTLDEFTVNRTSRANRRFDALDQNDDGALSAEEYEAAASGGFIRRRGGLELDQAALEQCMRDQLGTGYEGRPSWEDLATDADTSGDSLIDQAEYLAFQEAKAMARFADIDTNGDGELNDAELEVVKSQMQKRREAGMTCVMEQRELNGVLDI